MHHLTLPLLARMAIAVVALVLSASLLNACGAGDGKEGDPAAFGVTGVMGGAPPQLRYQWRRDGIDIRGATQEQLVLGITARGDNRAKYDVVITNTAGNIVSKPGVLVVVSGDTEIPER